MLKKTIALALAMCCLLAALPALAASQSPSFGAFEAEDIRGGDPVTEAIFAEAELTLVNFWATWCPPCREELPDLAKVSELSEGRVQVVGVLMDGVQELTLERDEDVIETANVLLDAAESTYPTLVPDEWLAQLFSVIAAVPTTFMIDSEGRVIAAREGSATAEEWLALAEEALNGAAK